MTKSDGTRHTLADLYHERTEFQFVARSWRWAILSGVLILISLVSLATRQLNLGIDFEGGTAWQFTVSRGSADAGDVRDVLRDFGQADAKVLVLGDEGVRVTAEDLPAGQRDRVTEALAAYGGVDVTDVSVTDVGPTWGEQVSEKALRALVVSFLLIGLYLAFRLEWRMSVAAIIAVLHDVIITAGVYSVTQFEVTPATVVAFLTILGFSLYDTVVVFDKVRENQANVGTVPGDTYSAMVNRSLNQVLMRSLNTTLVALLPVGSLLVVGTWLFGAVSLRDFALALFVGLAAGAYSSIFVATPIVAWWKERDPRYRALRERSASQVARAEGRAAAARVLEPESVAAEVVGSGNVRREAESEPAGISTPVPTPARAPELPEPRPAPRPASRPSASGTPGVTPRPRQQRRKKRR